MTDRLSGPGTARRWLRKPLRFFQISASERRTLVLAVAVLACMRVALYVIPTQRLLRIVLGRAVGRTAFAAGVQPVLVGRAVRRAAQLVPRATCLPQALTVIWILGGRGEPSTLRIGVRKGEAGELLAHAWVEHGSRVIIGDHGLAQYAVLPDLEGALWLR